MTTVTVAAPQLRGVKKVSLTTALKAETGLSLSASKSLTDRIIEGESVGISVPSRESADRLVAALKATGVVATIDPVAVPTPMAG